MGYTTTIDGVTTTEQNAILSPILSEIPSVQSILPPAGNAGTLDGNEIGTVQDAISLDLGTAANPSTPVIPTPSGLPSVDSVIGPSENDVISAAGINNAATSAAEIVDAIDPNPTGILATFAQGAGSGSVSGQSAANQPLGPQESYEDVTPTTTTAASGGSSSTLLIGILVVGGIGAYLYFRKHHLKVPHV